jgi:hypothetical protein
LSGPDGDGGRGGHILVGNKDFGLYFTKFARHIKVVVVMVVEIEVQELMEMINLKYR